MIHSILTMARWKCSHTRSRKRRKLFFWLKAKKSNPNWSIFAASPDAVSVGHNRIPLTPLFETDIMNQKPAKAWEMFLKYQNSKESTVLLHLIANDCYKVRKKIYSWAFFLKLSSPDGTIPHCTTGIWHSGKDWQESRVLGGKTWRRSRSTAAGDCQSGSHVSDWEIN